MPSRQEFLCQLPVLMEEADLAALWSLTPKNSSSSKLSKSDSLPGTSSYICATSSVITVLEIEERAKLDSVMREDGDLYIDGIQPMFDPLKGRRFDPSWNWARQDSLLMWYDIIFGRLTAVDREISRSILCQCLRP
jgi:hypothetical protein